MKLISYSDKMMAFGFYAMIFFLPIASAFVESFFGVILLGYFIKRGAFFVQNLRAESQEGRVSWGQRIFLFLKSYQPVANPLNCPIGFFLLAAFLSIFFSQYPGLSTKAFVFKLLQGTFLCLLFIETMRTPKRLRIFLIILSLSLTLIVTNGIFQYFTQEEFIHYRPVTDGRITSAFKHANNLAAYLITILPFLATTFFVSEREWPSVKRLRWFIGPLLVATVICLGLTFSRGAWAAAGVSCLLLVVRKPKLLAVFLCAMVLFGSIFIPKMMKERQINVVTEQGFFETSGRVAYWQEAINIIQDYPILGAGLNTYSLVAKDYKIRWGGYPHNCYLQMAAEMGIVGLLAFLSILFVLFSYGFQQLKTIKHPFWRNGLLGFVAGLLAFLLQSALDTNFYSVKLGSLLWLTMGLIVAISRVDESMPNLPPLNFSWDEPTRKRIRKILVLFFVGSGLLVFSHFQRTRQNPRYAEAFYKMGMKCEECTDEKRIAYFRKSIYYNPKLAEAYYELAVLYEKSRDDRVWETYKKAVEADPLHDPSAMRLGLHYLLEDEDIQAAAVYFGHAVQSEEIHPHEKAKAFYYLAQAREKLGQPEEAIQAYQQSLVYNNNSVKPYLRIGILAYRLGRQDLLLQQILPLTELPREDLPRLLEELSRGTFSETEILQRYNIPEDYFREWALE